MANRKTSLGTAYRRHPPLRTASPALAGTVPQPLAARREVRRSTSIVEPVTATTLPLTGQVLVEMRVRELAETHDRLLQQTQDLAQRAEGLDSEYGGLKQIVDGAVRKLDRVTSDLEGVTAGDSALQLSLATALQRLRGGRADAEAIARDLKRFQYEQLTRRVCAAVEATVPGGAIVLVVSKGDQRLIDFHGRTGWHFPRNEKGVYAGHHPADSAAAIEALERLRGHGAGYLVIPEVALWWLHHYVAFRERIDRHCRVAFRHERTGVIYALGPSTGSGSSRAKSRVGSAEARR